MLDTLTSNPEIINFSTYIALLIAAALLLLGVFASLFPEPMSKQYGIPANGLALPFVRATGIRDLFMGLTVLYLYLTRNTLALAWIHLAIAVVAITDFAIVRKYGDKKMSFVHLMGTMAVLIYAWWLFEIQAKV